MRLKVSDSDSEVGIEVTKFMWAATLERSRKLEDQSLLETANVTNDSERDARLGLLWVFYIQSKMNSRTPTRPGLSTWRWWERVIMSLVCNNDGPWERSSVPEHLQTQRITVPHAI